MPRAATTAKALNFELHLVGPQELKRLYPIAALDGVVGAAFIPKDGYVDPYGLTQAYAKGARRGGVTIAEEIAAHAPDWPERHPEEAARHGPRADASGLAIARAWVGLV